MEHQTQHYVVELLTLFSRAEALHADDGGTRGPKPLALMLKDALEAPTETERSAA